MGWQASSTPMAPAARSPLGEEVCWAEGWFTHGCWDWWLLQGLLLCLNPWFLHPLKPLLILCLSSHKENLGVIGGVVFGRSYSEAPLFHSVLSCEPRKSLLRFGFCLSPSPFFQHWLTFGTSPSLATYPARWWHTSVVWHGAGAGNKHAPCPTERWRQWPLGMLAGRGIGYREQEWCRFPGRATHCTCYEYERQGAFLCSTEPF